MIDTSFINMLIEDLGFYTIVIPLLVIAAIFTLPKFVDSTTYFKSRKIKYINEALDSNWVDSDSKKILSESISSIYLYNALNIKADRNKVKEIIKIHSILNDEFSTIDIYHALRYLPIFFYDYPLSTLNERRNKIELMLKSSKLVLAINAVVLSISSMVFIYTLSIAIYNGVFFTNIYLINEFSFIVFVISSGLIVLFIYFELNKMRKAIYILDYRIASL